MGSLLGPFVIAAVGLFGHAGPSHVVIDGSQTEVRWSDGDSFRILSGRYQGKGTRLMGYNSLESYGPVHSWGSWTAEELYGIAKRAGGFARSREWQCTTDGKTDHYDRLLVRCDDLTIAIASVGLGHLFEVDGTSGAAAIAAQKKAIEGKKGMWEKGVPEGLLTSLHSVDEKNWDGGKAYNRVADPKTGATTQVAHGNGYGACEKVCMQGSCMIYVPFEQRYGRNRAECLSHRAIEAPATQAVPSPPPPSPPAPPVAPATEPKAGDAPVAPAFQP